MFYLIYVSSSADPMTTDDLLFLSQESRDKNRERGITGLLLYKDGSFMQMLEGDKQAVLGLYEKIVEDQRHTGILTIMSGEIEERNFDQWSMGFCNLDDPASLRRYRDYVSENLVLRSFESGAQDAYRFMVSFSRRME